MQLNKTEKWNKIMIKIYVSIYDVKEKKIHLYNDQNFILNIKLVF